MPRQISDVSSEYSNRTEQWERIRDAIEGQDEIKDQGQRYLPKPSGMTAEAYKAYKLRAEFYSVTERTLRGMSGMVFRHDPVVDLPAKLEPYRNAASTAGHSLNVLIENIVNELLSVGRYGLLVDFSSEDTTATSIPHLATYTAENITDWELCRKGGMRKLKRLVLKEDLGEEDESNEESRTTEMRLELLINDEGNYEVRRWRSEKDKGLSKKSPREYAMQGDPVVPTVNGKPLTEIPFVFINPYDLQPEIEKPPMLDLVNVNLGHYRNSADMEQSLFLTSQPTAVLIGGTNEKDKPHTIGAGVLWQVPLGGDAKYLEFTGAGIEAQRRAMLDKEDRMSALGARMIQDSQNRNETTSTAKMRGRSEMSLITNVVNMAEAGVTRALHIAAEWVNEAADTVMVKLNRDWVETKMEPAQLKELVMSWQAGAISHNTLHRNLQTGEIVAPDRSFDEEKALIEEEGGGLLPPEPIPNG